MGIGKRIVTIFEILIVLTLFAMFSGMVITTQSNNAIIKHTEKFVELVRYKGCVTSQMYDDFLNGFDSVVDVRMEASHYDQFAGADALPYTQFTGDIINAMESTPDHIYTMNTGDNFSVIVRRPAGSLYDTIIGSLTGKYAAGDCPVVAIKGGMILNEQWR